MTVLTCEQFRELAPELALDVLPGAERATAIAHFEGCAACRDHLPPLTAVGDGLLGLVPGHEPSGGFETRVLNHLRPTTHARRRRGGLLVAAAVAIVAVAGLGGSVVGAVTNPNVPVAAAAQPFRTGTFTLRGHKTGQIFLYTGAPAWVYMATYTDHPTDKIICQVRRTDGSFVTIGEFPVGNGYGYWGAPLNLNPAAITEARLVAADGTVLATSNLHA